MFSEGCLIKTLVGKHLRNLLANITGWQVLRVILGLTLLTAGLLKVHELSTTPYLDEFPPRWMMIVFTELEMLFALWLFVVPRRSNALTWLAALSLFSFFTCVTLYKALTGEASCGCFGRVEINPWYTLIFDSTVVALLLGFRPEGTRLMSRETWLPAHALRSEGGVASLFTARASVVGSIWLLFCIPSAWSIASFVETDARASLSTLGQVFEGPDGKPVVVLEPQRWVGKPFDLPANIESFSDRESTDPLAVRQELKQGSWTVLLYHYGCPNCQRKIEDLRERKDSNTVLVEVAPDERRNYKLDFRIMRLSTRHKWLVTTPVVIEVKNGVVQKIDTRKSS